MARLPRPRQARSAGPALPLRWRARRLLRIGGEASRSAQAVAALRVQFERPHTPDGDPDAQRRMCAGMHPARSSWARSHVLARTRFVDGAVLDALARGVMQVVIVGAGYDDRALRFRSPQVRFFEVDHPATQADKRRRLRAIAARSDGLSLVPADVRRDDVSRALAAAGHDPGRASLFVCEGLLVYLERSVIAALLATLAAAAGTGSALAVTLAVHREGHDSHRVIATAGTRRPSPPAEPWLTILSLSEQLGLLHDAGWCEQRTLDELGLAAAGVGPGSAFVLAHPRRRATV